MKVKKKKKKKKKCCINDLNINFIVFIVPFVSRYVKSADFGVLNIVSSTWLKNKGTGVKGYFSTSAISPFLCNGMYKMLPNKSRIKYADKTFPSDAVIFCFPVCVANDTIAF